MGTKIKRGDTHDEDMTKYDASCMDTWFSGCGFLFFCNEYGVGVFFIIFFIMITVILGMNFTGLFFFFKLSTM